MADISQHNVKSLGKKSLSNVVAHHLEREIFGGRIIPGSRINEVKISKELGVSRGPVREACRSLVSAGWLDFVSQRGCFVREVSFSEAMEIYEIRIANARLIGELAAERITTKQLEHLKGLFPAMRDANQKGDTAETSVVSINFHRSLAETTGNKKLVELFVGLHYQHRLFRLGALARFEGYTDKLVEWEQTDIDGRKTVIDAISTGNKQMSGDAYAKHIARSRDRSENLYSQLLMIQEKEGRRAAG